jgi:hypothetical protein
MRKAAALAAGASDAVADDDEVTRGRARRVEVDDRRVRHRGRLHQVDRALVVVPIRPYAGSRVRGMRGSAKREHADYGRMNAAAEHSRRRRDGTPDPGSAAGVREGTTLTSSIEFAVSGAGRVAELAQVKWQSCGAAESVP